MKRFFALLFIATVTFSCSSTDKASIADKEVIENEKPVKMDISGKYTILELNGNSLKDKDFGSKTPMMLLDKTKMRYSTNIGCNQINGGYKLEENTIKFLPGMATMMACPNDLESTYLKALEEVDNFKIENFMLKVYKGDELKIVFQPLKR